MKAFKMAQPKTLAGAQSVLGGDFAKSKILAGGTDLIAMVKEGVATPDMLVNLKGLAALKKVAVTDRGVEIGALVTMDDLANNAVIARDWPALSTTVKKSATPQVRHVATVAGNLCQRPRCSYFRHESYECLKKGGKTCPAREGVHEAHAIFDNKICNAPHVSNMAPVFIAYDALVEIADAKGRRTVGMEEFFVAPDQDVTRENILKPNEVVTAIILPKGNAAKSAYVEARQKQSYDWALAGSTVRLELDGKKVKDCRVVLSAVAPTPHRRRDLEDMLKGKTLSDKRIADVAEAAVKAATPLRDNGYKSIMLKAVLSRALRQAREA